MKQLTICLATLVLTCFALAPAAARADELDDLEVTMEVFDDLGQIDGEIAEMDGPDRDDMRAGEEYLEEEEVDEADEGSAEDDYGLEQEDEFDEYVDDFEDDSDFEDESDLHEEDDFEEDEGEDLDEDEYDLPEYDDMEEEEDVT